MASSRSRLVIQLATMLPLLLKANGLKESDMTMINMPIAAMVARLAEGRMTVDDAAQSLMTRPLKEE